MKSRRLGVSLRVIWYLVLFFLYAPLFVVVLYSFNDANTTTHITHFSHCTQSGNESCLLSPGISHHVIDNHRRVY